jgi:hypothetical protein
MGDQQARIGVRTTKEHRLGPTIFKERIINNEHRLRLAYRLGLERSIDPIFEAFPETEFFKDIEPLSHFQRYTFAHL